MIIGKVLKKLIFSILKIIFKFINYLQFDKVSILNSHNGISLVLIESS